MNRVLTKLAATILWLEERRVNISWGEVVSRGLLALGGTVVLLLVAVIEAGAREGFVGQLLGRDVRFFFLLDAAVVSGGFAAVWSWKRLVHWARRPERLVEELRAKPDSTAGRMASVAHVNGLTPAQIAAMQNWYQQQGQQQQAP
jgi:hypothetical protein